jgi:hypothetical protein
MKKMSLARGKKITFFLLGCVIEAKMDRNRHDQNRKKNPHIIIY